MKSRYVLNVWGELCRGQEGQDLVEYTLLLAAVVLAGAAAIVSMGDMSTAIWTKVNTRLANASGT